jgi:hypothetical protein
MSANNDFVLHFCPKLFTDHKLNFTDIKALIFPQPPPLMLIFFMRGLKPLFTLFLKVAVSRMMWICLIMTLLVEKG